MSNDVTALLARWKEGDRGALDALIPLLYEELRRVAKRYLVRERPNHTLSPTALVHEAFVRLTGVTNVDWQGRAQFVGVAAQIMRHILVDHARAHVAEKRGGGTVFLSLDASMAPANDTNVIDVIAVDDVLNRLAVLDPRQATVVEMRFFGGLTVEETATAMELSPATVKREWQFARAWLHREIYGHS